MVTVVVSRGDSWPEIGVRSEDFTVTTSRVNSVTLNLASCV